MAGRVYRRHGRYIVVWQKSRSARSLAEAKAMALLEQAPPRKQTEVDPAVVGEVRHLRASGVSYAEIGRQLTAQGARPPRGPRWIYSTLRAVAERS